MFSRLAPLVRNHMHLRYIVNPIAGFTSAATVDARAALQARARRWCRSPPAPRSGRATRRRRSRRSLVLVVGETARADHFSLNGYRARHQPRARQGRRAELSQRPLVRHRHARLGAVHVLAARQGGVREAQGRAREPARRAAGRRPGRALARQPGRLQGRLRPRADARRPPTCRPTSRPRLCSDGECLDEALLVGLDERIAALPEERRKQRHRPRHAPDGQPRAGVLQALAAGAEALPARVHERRRSASAIRSSSINAYDNTIVATDHFLADTIAWLKGRTDDYAPALLYMSDHGESLGELRHLPARPAVRVRARGAEARAVHRLARRRLAARRGLDVACLRGRLDAPLSHDNLYHSVARPARRDDADLPARARRVRAVPQGALRRRRLRRRCRPQLPVASSLPAASANVHARRRDARAEAQHLARAA